MHDRQFAMSDKEGNLLIGKTNPLVHSLRSEIDFEKDTILLRHQEKEQWNTFHLKYETKEIQAWLTDFFQTPVYFHQNTL